MTAAVVTFRVEDIEEIDEKAEAAGVTRSEFLRGLVASNGKGGGVWVVGYYVEPLHSIHPTEIEALREHAKGFGQFVKFWPWGPAAES